MTANDILLIVTWVVGIGGALVSGISARKRVRAEAQLTLDKASFSAAENIIELLRSQIGEMRAEMSTMRGELSALRAREGKLLRRIQTLEFMLKGHGIDTPNHDE